MTIIDIGAGRAEPPDRTLLGWRGHLLHRRLARVDPDRRGRQAHVCYAATCRYRKTRARHLGADSAPSKRGLVRRGRPFRRIRLAEGVILKADDSAERPIITARVIWAPEGTCDPAGQHGASLGIGLPLG